MHAFPLKSRLFFATAGVSNGETMLQMTQRRGQTPPASVIRVTVDAYAYLECVESDLCAAATVAGAAQDLAAATAAQQRMADLCAQLRLVPGFKGQCP
jgi:hypothetical protein